MVKAAAPKADVYAKITDSIVAALESGTKPWAKPWKAGQAMPMRPLRANGIPYRGINTIVLWAAASTKGHTSPFWLTYKQAADLGGNVRKGEKSETVVYATTFEKADVTNPDKTVRIPFLKAYAVFNACQCENLPARFTPAAELPATPAEASARLVHADAFFANTLATIRTGGSAAYYSPATDHIQMPAFEAFTSAEAHTATLAHESIHWTSAANRCDRADTLRRFGNESYAREELVAELGAAFICADLGIDPTLTLDNNAAYIASWIKVLKNDKRAIFTAATAAQKAADFLHAFQPDAVPAEDFEPIAEAA